MAATHAFLSNRQDHILALTARLPRSPIGAYGLDFADSYRYPVERTPRRHDIGCGSGSGFGS
jgi:hypothetical protein